MAKIPVVKKNYTILPVHVAMIEENAEDRGLLSASASLRFILDEWDKKVAQKRRIYLNELRHARNRA